MLLPMQRQLKAAESTALDKYITARVGEGPAYDHPSQVPDWFPEVDGQTIWRHPSTLSLVIVHAGCLNEVNGCTEHSVSAA